MPTTKFFLDAIVQQSFETNGYVKLSLVKESELNRLNDLYQKYFSTYKTDQFSYSNFENNKQINFDIQEEIKEVLIPHLKKHLINFRTILGLFYIKPAGKKSKFYSHRDWSIVDESKSTSLNIWLPLTATTKINGNLVVVPGSHKTKSLRGSPALSLPKTTLSDKIKNTAKQKNIYTKAGEAILFDHRLMHSSKNNLSDNFRIVAALSVISKDAKVVHYHQDNSGKIERFEVEDDFYLQINAKDFNQINLQKSLGFIDKNNW